MNWSVFGKAFLCETVYAIPFFILSILPFKKQLRFPIKILILFIFIGQLLQSSLYTYLISHGKPTLRHRHGICPRFPGDLFFMCEG